MGTLVTVLAGLALAGATAFGLVTAQGDTPSGNPPAVTYDSGQ